LASLDSFVNWQPDDTKPYYDPRCNSDAILDHVVLVTGWRTYASGVWGWEIENSWSDLWGDHGYGYIRGGLDEHGNRTDCGITLR
jgi:C1A family cysteine protease